MYPDIFWFEFIQFITGPMLILYFMLFYFYIQTIFNLAVFI